MTEYYVSLNGDNSNDGMSEATAWRTIQHAAINASLPGDVVEVKEGVYTEPEVMFNVHSGILGFPIIFRPYLNETVIVEGVMNIDGKSWIVLDGFVCQNGSYGGVLIVNGASNNIVRNLEVKNATGIGVYIKAGPMGQTSNNKVFNCWIHDNSSEGIYLKGGLFGQLIEDNIIELCIIHDNGMDGIQNTTDEDTKPTRTIIRQNVLYRNSSWAAMDLSGDGLLVEKNHVFLNFGDVGGIFYATGNGAIIRNNLIYKNQGVGEFATGIWVADGATNTKVYQNTVAGHTTGLGRGIRMNVGTGCEVKNNISAGNLDQFFVGEGTPTSDTNLFFGLSTDTGLNPILLDPEFIDPANDNYMIAVTSPAKDAGLNLGVGDDIIGTSRPQGLAPDVGVYEYKEIDGMIKLFYKYSGEMDWTEIGEMNENAEATYSWNPPQEGDCQLRVDADPQDGRQIASAETGMFNIAHPVEVSFLFPIGGETTEVDPVEVRVNVVW